MRRRTGEARYREERLSPRRARGIGGARRREKRHDQGVLARGRRKIDVVVPANLCRRPTRAVGAPAPLRPAAHQGAASAHIPASALVKVARRAAADIIAARRQEGRAPRRTICGSHLQQGASGARPGGGGIAPDRSGAGRWCAWPSTSRAPDPGSVNFRSSTERSMSSCRACR